VEICKYNLFACSMVVRGIVDLKSSCWLFKCWWNAFCFFSPYGQMVTHWYQKAGSECFFLCYSYILSMMKSEIMGDCGIPIEMSLVWSLDNLLKENYRHYGWTK
jgi:hypothetical protein